MKKHKGVDRSMVIVGREFNRNMFVMLIAIMVGAVIITYFVADIVNRSTIETITTQHVTEIRDIYSVNENFTDNFLQGSIKMDSAREVREVGNYHFDFALFWYNTALSNLTNSSILNCIGNCTSAMVKYLTSHQRFDESKPYFETAKTFTDKDKYIEVLGYYTKFAQAGKNITMLRYYASKYLMSAAENLSLGNMENVSLLMDLFNETEELYEEELEEYEEYQDQIDGYLFFNEIREED